MPLFAVINQLIYHLTNFTTNEGCKYFPLTDGRIITENSAVSNSLSTYLQSENDIFLFFHHIHLFSLFHVDFILLKLRQTGRKSGASRASSR